MLFLKKNLVTLKQLTHVNSRKRTVSMSSTARVSSEESTCTNLNKDDFMSKIVSATVII